MRAKIVGALLAAVCLAAAVWTAHGAPQNAPPMIVQPDYSTVNCSGFFTDQKVPSEVQLISGEQSNYKITFTRGDSVYINRGQDKGVRVGDRFFVVRPDANKVGVHVDWLTTNDVQWFKWQEKLLKAMGTAYMDAGQVRVVNVQPKVSIAQVNFSCNYMQRGDVLVPYQDRQIPPFKAPEAFDHFAPVSGKPVAMVVSGKQFAILDGTNDVIYVNLGTSQGVKVGDYFRIFRYQGTEHETAYQTKRAAFDIYGYGSAPAKYQWDNVPREVIGEGVVVRAAPNSSSVLITFSLHQIYAGDYVEVE